MEDNFFDLYLNALLDFNLSSFIILYLIISSVTLIVRLRTMFQPDLEDKFGHVPEVLEALRPSLNNFLSQTLWSILWPIPSFFSLLNEGPIPKQYVIYELIMNKVYSLCIYSLYISFKVSTEQIATETQELPYFSFSYIKANYETLAGIDFAFALVVFGIFGLYLLAEIVLILMADDDDQRHLENVFMIPIVSYLFCYFLCLNPVVRMYTSEDQRVAFNKIMIGEQAKSNLDVKEQAKSNPDVKEQAKDTPTNSVKEQAKSNPDVKEQAKDNQIPLEPKSPLIPTIPNGHSPITRGSEQNKLIVAHIGIIASYLLEKLADRILEHVGFAALLVLSLGALLAYLTANEALLGGTVTGALTALAALKK